MHHSQVPVQTDAAKEANADVDVLIEQETTQFTQPLPVTPVIPLRSTRPSVTSNRHGCQTDLGEIRQVRYLEEVVQPQRQREQVQQIGHGEVYQVNPQLVLLLQLLSSVVQRVQVRRHANLQPETNTSSELKPNVYSTAGSKRSRPNQTKQKVSEQEI